MQAPWRWLPRLSPPFALWRHRQRYDPARASPLSDVSHRMRPRPWRHNVPYQGRCVPCVPWGQWWPWGHGHGVATGAPGVTAWATGAPGATAWAPGALGAPTSPASMTTSTLGTASLRNIFLTSESYAVNMEIRISLERLILRRHWRRRAGWAQSRQRRAAVPFFASPRHCVWGLDCCA